MPTTFYLVLKTRSLVGEGGFGSHLLSATPLDTDHSQILYFSLISKLAMYDGGTSTYVAAGWFELTECFSIVAKTPRRRANSSSLSYASDMDAVHSAEAVSCTVNNNFVFRIKLHYFFYSLTQ